MTDEIGTFEITIIGAGNGLCSAIFSPVKGVSGWQRTRTEKGDLVVECMRYVDEGGCIEIRGPNGRHDHLATFSIPNLPATAGEEIVVEKINKDSAGQILVCKIRRI